jgi:RsiW-degrading membrane proteinase PrsW (M82 family)
VKIITLLAVMAMLLLSVAMPTSSVGGPLTIMLILFLVMLAVGIHEAWLKKCGVPGWIMNIVVSVIGGFVAAGFAGMAVETILPHLHHKPDDTQIISDFPKSCQALESKIFRFR